jgi:hypothetical protein
MNPNIHVSKQFRLHVVQILFQTRVIAYVAAFALPAIAAVLQQQ